MLGCTDDVTANYFSARSGDMSIQIQSTMMTKQSMAVTQMIPQYRETLGHGRRKLLTPDEVLRLPRNEMLVVIRGQNILRLTKFDYTNHPMSTELIPVSIYDYNPEDQYYLPVTEFPAQPYTKKNQELPEEEPASPVFSYAKARMEGTSNTPDF